MGMWLRLSFLVVCQSRYCTTTPKLLLPVFWVMANANEHGCSQNWYPIICLRIGLAVLVRATIRVRSRAWLAIPAATSWYPNPGSPVLMISMSIWQHNAASGWVIRYAVTPRRLVNGLQLMLDNSNLCLPLPMMPVTSNRFG